MSELLCELAKSARSSCKYSKCEERTIPKGSLRIGRIVQSLGDMKWDSTSWYHPQCFFAMCRKSIKDTLTESSFKGFDNLPEKEKATLRALLAGSSVPEPPSTQSSDPSPPCSTSNSSASYSASSSLSSSSAPPPPKVKGVTLEAFDGSCSVSFLQDGVFTFGRETPELVSKVSNKKKFSKTQAEIVIKTGAKPQFKSLGVNPTILIIPSAEDDGSSRVIKDQEVVELVDGCHLVFCADEELDFMVKYQFDDTTASTATSKVGDSQPSGTSKKKEPVKRTRKTSVSVIKKKRTKPKVSSSDEDDDGYSTYEEEDDDENDPTYRAPLSDDDDDDYDYEDESDGDHRPWCKYGSACYRTNKQHLLDYRHPKKK